MLKCPILALTQQLSTMSGYRILQSAYGKVWTTCFHRRLDRLPWWVRSVKIPSARSFRCMAKRHTSTTESNDYAGRGRPKRPHGGPIRGQPPRSHENSDPPGNLRQLARLPANVPAIIRAVNISPLRNGRARSRLRGRWAIRGALRARGLRRYVTVVILSSTGANLGANYLLRRRQMAHCSTSDAKRVDEAAAAASNALPFRPAFPCRQAGARNILKQQLPKRPVPPSPLKVLLD